MSHIKETHELHLSYEWDTRVSYQWDSCTHRCCLLISENHESHVNETHESHITERRDVSYGVATMSRLLKNIGLFCKRALQKRPVFCKETCILKNPTHRSHPISKRLLRHVSHINETHDTHMFWLLISENHISHVNETHESHITETRDVSYQRDSWVTCLISMSHDTYMCSPLIS